MWFLVKSAFWFAIVLMLLPLANPATEAKLNSGPQVHIGATVAAATSALDDLTGICTRRPDVCKTGGETLAALGVRARDGALIAYRFLDDRFGRDASETVITGTVAPAPAADPAQPKQAGAAEIAAAVPVPAQAPLRPQAGRASMVGEVYLPRPYSPPIR